MISCPNCSAQNSVLNTHCAKCGVSLTLNDYDPMTVEESDIVSIDLLQKHCPNFEIIEHVGQGGMGSVFKAKDRVLDRFVAIKTLSNHKLASSMKSLILREAKLACGLNHDNIATIYDVSRSDELAFIVMEWVEGQTLESVIGNQDYDYLDRLNIAEQVANGVAHAHKRGIIHRDLKPANIMLCEATDRVKILDFGIAEQGYIEDSHLFDIEPKERSEDLRETTLAGARGTVPYMSPEQLAARQLTEKSDIFSFGIILYELFTGVHPFQGKTNEEVQKKIQLAMPDASLLSDAPAAVRRLILDCLALDMSLRPASMLNIIKNLSNQLVKENNRKSKNIFYWLSSWRLAVISLAFVIVTGSVVYYSAEPILSDRHNILSQGKKIAILPFENLSADPHIDLYASGLTADLNIALAKLSKQNNSWVIPVSEIIKIEDPTAKEVFTKYNVDLVISGSIQHFGEKRRLIVNLINAEDSRLIESLSFDFSVEDIFDNQNKVKIKIAELLNWKGIDSYKDDIKSISMSKAFEHYLTGLGYLYRYDYKDNLDKAIGEFEAAINENPDFTLALQEITRAYIRKATQGSILNSLEYATKYSEQLLALSPTSSVYALHGDVQFRKSNYSSAEASYKKAIELDEMNPDAYFGLGRLYHKIGEYEKAEEKFLRAISINQNWIYWNDLAYFYYRTNQLTKAEEAYQVLSDMTPNNVYGLQMLGAIANAKGNLKLAKKSFAKAIRLQPEDPYNYSNLASILFFEGEYAESVPLYQKAVSLNDKSYALYGNLADAYRWSNEQDKAVANYLTAVELIDKQIALKPNNISLVIKRSLFLTKAGLENKVLDDRDIDLKINDSHLLVLLAQVFELKGQRDKAVKYLEKAITLGHPLNSLKAEPEFKSLMEETYLDGLSLEGNTLE